jgi:membrane protein DedA with SNARE-associated domain
MRALQRNGVMAVLVPSLLPPPAPFKVFVLLAGVVGISAVRFATAIAIGRGVRYLALGVLAVKYGDRAMAYMRERGTVVSIAAVAVLAAGFGAYLLWSRRKPINADRM